MSKTSKYALAGALGTMLVWLVGAGLGLDERFSFPARLGVGALLGVAVGLVVMGIGKLVRSPSA